MQSYGLDIISIFLVVFGAAMLVTAWLFGCYGQLRVRRYIRSREAERNEEKDEEPEAEKPMVSLIAFSNGDTEEIGAWLESISTQDYLNREAMVVIMGNKRQCDYVAELYARYQWAHFTFIPPEHHNVSLRKLAYTLGVKGTSGEIIVTADTYCRPSSSKWLGYIVENFRVKKCEMVLGYAWLDFSSAGKKWLAGWCQRDAFVHALRWMNYAIAGQAYRGDGNNMAFRRSTFLANRGYQSSYFLHPGYDDIFVYQIATGYNCSVELRSDARVRIDAGADAFRRWVDRKETMAFTSRYLRKWPAVKASLYTLFLWVATTVLVLAMIFSHTLWVVIASAAILLAGWCGIAMSYAGVARYFTLSTSRWGFLSYSYLQPIADAIFNIRYHSRKKKNYTWQK